MFIVHVIVVVMLGGCFTFAGSVGGTINGRGRIDWVGQASVGPNMARANGQVVRMMVDTRFYSLDGYVHVGVGIGVDLVERSYERSGDPGRSSQRGPGQHVGARIGMGGMVDGRAPRDAPNPIDLRLSAEYGLALGSTERYTDETGHHTFTATTGGVTFDTALHTKASGLEHLQLGARMTGEVMMWQPRRWEPTSK